MMSNSSGPKYSFTETVSTGGKGGGEDSCWKKLHHDSLPISELSDFSVSWLSKALPVWKKKISSKNGHNTKHTEPLKPI